MINVVNKKTHKPDGEKDFYIGRGSPLGNVYDFKNSNHSQVKYHVNSRGDAILGFKDYLEKEVKDGNPEICYFINKLIIRNLLKKDTNLVCYCSPSPCHGDIIKEFVEKQKYCINWFSNMRKLDYPIVYQGLEYQTVENFYQAMKTEKNDLKTREKISRMPPFKSKSFNDYKFDAERWSKIRLSVMEYALKIKFSKDTSWGQKLLNFNGGLIEWNNWGDKFWGISIFNGEGQNNLGKILEKLQKNS